MMAIDVVLTRGKFFNQLLTCTCQLFWFIIEKKHFLITKHILQLFLLLSTIF
jgi:hypothetical protein